MIKFFLIRKDSISLMKFDSQKVRGKCEGKKTERKNKIKIVLNPKYLFLLTISNVFYLFSLIGINIK